MTGKRTRTQGDGKGEVERERGRKKGTRGALPVATCCDCCCCCTNPSWRDARRVRRVESDDDGRSSHRSRIEGNTMQGRAEGREIGCCRQLFGTQVLVLVRNRVVVRVFCVRSQCVSLFTALPTGAGWQCRCHALLVRCSSAPSPCTDRWRTTEVW
jgi:hypothetical protein